MKDKLAQSLYDALVQSLYDARAQSLYDEELYTIANACINGKCEKYCNPAREECKKCRYSVYYYTDDERKASYNYALATSKHENMVKRIRIQNEYIKREHQRWTINLLAIVVVCSLMYEGWLTFIYGSNILLGLFFIRGLFKRSTGLFLLPIVCILIYKGMTESSEVVSFYNLKLFCVAFVLGIIAVVILKKGK